MRFTRVLVLDRLAGGFQAVARATDLAGRMGARLRLVASTDAQAAPGNEREVTERLERRAEPLRARGLDVTTAVLPGAWDDAILGEAHRWGADLVVDELERRPALLSRLAGRGQRRLVRHVVCPVWLVTKRARAGGPVVVGVNPQEEDGSISPLDSRIVETGVAFARALRVEIRVVHAWSFDIMPVLGRVSVDPERNRHAALEAHHAAAERLARFLAAAPFSIPRRNVHLLVGDPALVLQAVAAELRADAVVVGSVSRGRVTDFVSGHVDERVLSALPCSLVVVKSPEHGAVARRGPAGDAAHAHLSP